MPWAVRMASAIACAEPASGTAADGAPTRGAACELTASRLIAVPLDNPVASVWPTNVSPQWLGAVFTSANAPEYGSVTITITSARATRNAYTGRLQRECRMGPPLPPNGRDKAA